MNSWIERLRIVGLDRQRERRAAQNSTETDGNSPTPPPEAYAIPGKRRRAVGEEKVIISEDGLSRRKARRAQSENLEVEMES